MNLAPGAVLALCFLAAAACGFGDYLTGPELVFTSLYLVPIAAATWWLGRARGLVLTLFSVGIYVVADLLSRRTYLPPAGRVWNASVQLVVFMSAVAAVTAVKRRMEDLRQARLRLHMLSSRLVEVQESERRRIARELHDEIGQVLTVAKLALVDTERNRESVDFKSRVRNGIQALDGAIQQVRDMSLDLRPPLLDDLGLVPTLRWYLDRQGQESGIEGTFSVGPIRDRFPAEIEIACFRVAQECITNVLRHSNARRIWVDLREHRAHLQLLVRDDGRGFDPDEARARAAGGASMGLSSMEERVSLARGGISISSEAGSGTEIQAWFPVECAT